MNLLGLHLRYDVGLVVTTIVMLLWCVGAFVLAFRRGGDISAILKNVMLFVLGGMILEIFKLWRPKR